MTFANAHAKAQRREAIRVSKPQWFFAALRLCLIFFSLSFSAAVNAQTNTLSEAEIQGRKLAQQLLEQRPFTNSIQDGILQIRCENKTTTNVPIQFKVMASPLNNAIDWETLYETTTESNQVELIVNHKAGKPNAYLLFEEASRLGEPIDHPVILSGLKTMRPFAGSDFWFATSAWNFSTGRNKKF